MSAGPLPLARRTALTLGVAGIAVAAGCAKHTDEPGATPAAAPAATGDPDTALVASVIDALGDAYQLVGHLGDQHPGLTATTGVLAALHLAHLEALNGSAPTRGVAGPPPTRSPLGAVRRCEKRLRSTLTESAATAESGTLARLLASMSAAVGQQLASLPGAAG